MFSSWILTDSKVDEYDQQRNSNIYYGCFSKDPLDIARALSRPSAPCVMNNFIAPDFLNRNRDNIEIPRKGTGFCSSIYV